MSFGISKTIPAKAGVEALDSLYDGSLSEYEFHMAGQEPKRLKPGVVLKRLHSALFPLALARLRMLHQKRLVGAQEALSP